MGLLNDTEIIVVRYTLRGQEIPVDTNPAELLDGRCEQIVWSPLGVQRGGFLYSWQCLDVWLDAWPLRLHRQSVKGVVSRDCAIWGLNAVKETKDGNLVVKITINCRGEPLPVAFISQLF